MLIYVDKKKEKQKKIKILCLIICITLAVFINIKYFNIFQNSSTQSLTAYSRTKKTNLWYDSSAPTYLFSSKKAPQQNIIIIPKQYTKENVLILASVLSTLTQNEYFLTITPDVKHHKTIRKIVKSISPISQKSEAAQLIITTNLNEVESIIKKAQLYPQVFGHNNIQLIKNNPALTSLINDLFPHDPTPKTRTEKEQKNLELFIKENKKELQSVILHQQAPDFSKQYLFLQNIRFCLANKKTTHCNTSTQTSFYKNINKVLKKMQNTTPDKLILWTSNEEISAQGIANLQPDEGVLFQAPNREAYLLPNEIKTLTNPKEIIYTLKQRVGLNPQYSTPDMKLYKFKITEANLDDNI